MEANRNQLPSDWKWVKLKDISESIQYGYTESSSKEIVGPKFLRITDIQDNKVLWDDVPYCKIDSETKEKYLLKDGDLVFARTGATVGKSFLLKGVLPEAVFASYLIRVRVNKEVNEKYLSNFFHSSIYWAQITEGQVGIGQPNVNGTKLGQLDLPLAPKNTQEAIVSKIEELFSELDKGIENLRLAQQQLKTYRQSVLKWAFEGKFTEYVRTPVRVRSSPQEVSMAAEPEVEYGVESGLPRGWKILELKEVCEIKRGKSKHRPRNEPALYGGKYPFIQTGDIRNASGSTITKYIQTYSELGLQQSKLWPKGTLCITIAANIGETAILGFDACFPDSVVGLLCDEKLLLNKYANYFFISFKQKLEELAPATAQKNINVDILEKVKIPIAPIEEQTNIVLEIESRFGVADKMEESINQSLQQAEVLKQSILMKAFEGRLV